MGEGDGEKEGKPSLEKNENTQEKINNSRPQEYFTLEKNLKHKPRLQKSPTQTRPAMSDSGNELWAKSRVH